MARVDFFSYVILEVMVNHYDWNDVSETDCVDDCADVLAIN